MMPIPVNKVNINPCLDLYIPGIERMQSGMVIEHVVAKSCIAVEEHMLQLLGLKKGDPEAFEKIVAMEVTNPDVLETAWRYLEKFFAITALYLVVQARRDMGLPNHFYIRPRSLWLSIMVRNGVSVHLSDAVFLHGQIGLIAKLKANGFLFD